MQQEPVAKTDDLPVFRSDRGAHFRWPGWLTRMGDAKLIRSMSCKGCYPDNSACEGFFVQLKKSCFTLEFSRQQPLSNLFRPSIRIFSGTTKNESRYLLDHLVP